MDLLPPNLPAATTEELTAERTRQFLDCVFRVLGHDLPNHLIALQGLARLLAVEEAERLSPEGKEYVGRMAAAAGRAQALTVSLSSAGRLLTQAPAAEAVDVGEAVAEAVAAVKALCPGQGVEYNSPREPILATVPRPALDHVLTCLLRQGLSLAAGRRSLRVVVASPSENEAVEISLGNGFPAPSTDAGGDLNLFLARLLVEAWGGTIRLLGETAGRQTLLVTCPR